MDKLSAIEVNRKSGDEPFEINGSALSIDLLSFWQWSASDIIGNAMRGVLAEYIVASAVGNNLGVRVEWDAFDIETLDGIKIEVKSAAYVQSWEQSKLSTIQFGIQPTRAWDFEVDKRSIKMIRQADVYVFCLLKHKEKASINPLKLEQWEFYVLPTRELNKAVGTQKTITLNSLNSLDPIKSSYNDLYVSIKNAANK